jgi:hypothetical protein
MVALCVGITNDSIALQNPRTLLTRKYPSKVLGTIAVLCGKDPFDVTPDDVGYLDVTIRDGEVVSFSFSGEDDAEFETWWLARGRE